MIDVFFADYELYLNFLEIKKQNIPFKNNQINKQEFCKLVENHFRNLTRKYHPDFGGNDEQFQFLLKCKQIFINSENNDSVFSLSIDDSKFANYDKKSLASKIGDQLFELITSWKNILKIKPVFRPNEENDEYEWIFNTEYEEYQLSLNVQNLSQQYAELSNKIYKDDNLNILVCLFVPSKKLTVTNCAYDNSVLLQFNDKILIESSNAKAITEYFSSIDNIQNDLEKIYNNQFTSKTNELKTKNIQNAISADKKLLEYLQNIKLFSTTYDESAADFIDIL